MSLFPKNDEYFDLFDQSTAHIAEGIAAFQTLLKDPANFRENARKVKEIEHETDKVTHQTLAKLYTSFITPLDREDIHALITRLDDIMDAVDAATQRLVLFNVHTVPEEMKAFAQLLGLCAEQVRRAVSGLRQIGKPQPIMDCLIEINRLENEGDQLLRQAIGKLFSEEKDPIAILKWKELFEITEEATDQCERVAHVIEAIVLKHG
ncbi:MAG: DUF47 family protein [Bdellovibrionota bacterium]